MSVRWAHVVASVALLAACGRDFYEGGYGPGGPADAGTGGSGAEQGEKPAQGGSDAGGTRSATGGTGATTGATGGTGATTGGTGAVTGGTGATTGGTSTTSGTSGTTSDAGYLSCAAGDDSCPCGSFTANAVTENTACKSFDVALLDLTTCAVACSSPRYYARLANYGTEPATGPTYVAFEDGDLVIYRDDLAPGEVSPPFEIPRPVGATLVVGVNPHILHSDCDPSNDTAVADNVPSTLCPK